MSDRELLELAAKAAGMDGCEYRKSGPNNRDGMLFTNTLSVWNPLYDDGDALRLAVKLKLNITPECIYEGPWVDGGTLRDPYAATRRDIVRAAAEIGRGMQHE